MGAPDSVRKTFRALVVVVLGIATVLALVWFAWLPNYRPELREGELYGIDVFHHQGSIDWLDVAGDDISFAYIKATEGGDFSDDWFQANWTDATDAGLARGAYHFFTLCTSGDVQARHFLRTVPEDPVALPPAVDLELAGNCGARPSTGSVRREIAEFLQLVEAETERRVVLYVGDDFREALRDRGSIRPPALEASLLVPPGHRRMGDLAGHGLRPCRRDRGRRRSEHHA